MVFILIFSVVLFAVIYYIFRKLLDRYVISKVLDSSINIATLRQFENQKDNIRVLVLGACEFRSGIDPRHFKEHAFNFSMPMGGYPEEYYFLKHYIDKIPLLKALVFSVGDNSFCSYTSNGTTFPLVFNKFIDYREMASVNSPAMRLKLSWNKWLYSTYLGKLHYGSKRVIKGFFRKKSSPKTPGVSGVGVVQAQKDSSDIAVLKKEGNTFANAQDAVIGVKKHFSRPVLDQRALFYFEKIMELCQKKHLPVIAVTMPRSKYFLELAKDYMTEELFTQTIIGNPKYKDLFFSYLNYLNLYRDRDEFFEPQGVMLNAEGKQEFSRKLAEDVSGVMSRIESGAKQA